VGKSNNEENYLYSSENLIGWPFTGKETNFHYSINNIKNIFKEPQIILILREHSALISSLYSEFIKAGATIDFDEFLGRKNTTNLQNTINLNYMYYVPLINILFENFQNVMLVNYDSLKNDTNYTLFEIAKFCGGKYENIRSSRKHHNISPQKLGLKTIKTLNKFQNSPRNPKGIIPKTLLNRFKISPYNIAIDWFKFMNNYGTDLVKHDDLTYIRSLFKKDWEEVKSFFDKGVYIKSLS
jgi:hypothetical protein